MAFRLGAHAVTLTLITGLGMFVVGRAHGTTSWVAFVSATAIALSFAAMWARAALKKAGADTPHKTQITLRESASREPPPEPPSLEGGAENDVDYLMALRHEFRTPLNAVLGFSDVLLSGIDGEVNASQREDLEIIRASGIRLRILLDSALDLSQLDRGELRSEVERVDVCEVVRRASIEAGQLWSNKRSSRCSLPTVSCLVDVDEARLRRSILVLADFLATSHRNAEVSIDLDVSEDHLAIELKAVPSDGAPLDALPTPSEVLVSEDITQIRRWPLAVTSELITLLGGSLYHGRDPSRFLIRLPLTGDR